MQEIETVSERPKRPVFLLVLCILSFIWLGLGMSGTILSYAVGPSTAKEIKKEKANLDNEISKIEGQGANEWRATAEKFKTMTVTMNRKFYYVQALNLFIFTLGIIAVVLMFTGRKIGFHLYIGYSLLSICSYYFFVSPATVPTMIILFSASVATLFIVLYSRNLKWMR